MIKREEETDSVCEREGERTLENQFDVRQVVAMDQVGTTGAYVINLFLFLANVAAK